MSLALALSPSNMYIVWVVYRWKRVCLSMEMEYAYEEYARKDTNTNAQKKMMCLSFCLSFSVCVCLFVCLVCMYVRNTTRYKRTQTRTHTCFNISYVELWFCFMPLHSLDTTIFFDCVSLYFFFFYHFYILDSRLYLKYVSKFVNRILHIFRSDWLTFRIGISAMAMWIHTHTRTCMYAQTSIHTHSVWQYGYGWTRRYLSVCVCFNSICFLWRHCGYSCDPYTSR